MRREGAHGRERALVMKVIESREELDLAQSTTKPAKVRNSFFEFSTLHLASSASLREFPLFKSRKDLAKDAKLAKVGNELLNS